MSELQRFLDDAYGLAKAGRWHTLLERWGHSPVLARRCSRYLNPSSGWTFLHQAAYFGHEKASRLLIAGGAVIDVTGKDGRQPVDVAEQKGHKALAALLRKYATGRASSWCPPIDPDVLPSSSCWEEAQMVKAAFDFYIAYGGSGIRIPKGSTYYVDSMDRVLVGWHGTFDPPCDMDGESLVD